MEALWAYRYMQETGVEVNEHFPSAKIQAFKTLCVKDGKYKMKEEVDSEKRKKPTFKKKGLIG